jgi:hypothetical protein
MRVVGQVLRGLLALVVLLAVAAGVVWAIGLGARSVLRSTFAGVDPSVASAIVAGFVTVVVSVGGVLLTRYFERRKAVEEEIRATKIPMYTELVEGLFSALNGMSENGEVDTEATTALFQRLTPQLMTWASDDVLLSWSRWRRGLNTGAFVGPEVLFAFESVLQAIRKDYGHKNQGVSRGDLLGLFVNDVDEYLPGGSNASG